MHTNWLGNQEGEVANLPFSNVTKLSCLFLALGLQDLAGDNASASSLARKLVAIIKPKIDFVALKNAYGIKPVWINQDKAENVRPFTKKLKGAMKKVTNDRHVSTDEVRILKFSVMFMDNPSRLPNYLDRANKAAIQVGPNWFRNWTKVVDAVGTGTAGTGAAAALNVKSNIPALHEELKDVVAEITGKRPSDTALSVPNDVIQKMRLGSGKKAELAARYKKIRRDISVAYDLDLGAFLASQKGNMAYVDEAYRHMVKLGYKIHKLPVVEKRIPLKIGLSMGKPKYFTDDEKPLAQSIPSTAKKITFARTYNPDGTGAYLTYTSDMAAGVSRVFTEIHAAESEEKKSAAGADINAKMDSIISRWRRDMTSSDPIKKMGATAAIMIYLTAMRVGARQTSAASTTGVPTYGAISLRPRHITIKPAGIIIKYKGKSSGKSGVEQKHYIKVSGGDPLAKLLARNLTQLVAGKKGDQLVFSMPGAKGKKDIVLNYGQFSNYLKQSGYPAGIHKIRRVRGTNLMLDLLKTNKFKLSAKAQGNLTRSQKEAETFVINKILIPIANLLGHKSGTGADLWRTTAKSYIEPAPLIQWFTDRQLRIPKWLPKKATGD